jgi:serine/threonine-protein kinase
VADTLAVLPFRPLLPSERNPALELGMTNTLIAQLSNLPGVKVSALSAVRSFSASDQDAVTAGRKLQVATVLEGSIQRDAQRIRVTARLLRVADGHPMWSKQFDAPMSDIFAVQDTIATQVVEALAVTLSPDSHRRLLQQGTSNVEAYQLYVSGLYNWQRRLPQAVGEFEAALRADPNYALAWVGLADALSAQGVYGYEPPDEVFPRAKEAARKAIALAPDLAEAQVALGHILVQYENRFSEGEQQYLAARKLKEDYATTWQRIAIVRAYLGQIDAALSDMRHAQELEPTTLAYSANIGMMLYYSRANGKAIAHEKRVLALDAGQDQALTILGRALIETGDFEGALKLFAARRDSTPGSDGDMGRAYARAGRRDEAHAEIGRLKARAAAGFGLAYDVATIHAALQEIPAACAALEHAVADHSQMLGMLRVDPAIDNLRREPCYAKVERQLYND